jgi:CRISPR/Cas system endoribonuclease Cas6 (RAMP superfamily)
MDAVNYADALWARYFD